MEKEPNTSNMELQLSNDSLPQTEAEIEQIVSQTDDGGEKEPSKPESAAASPRRKSSHQGDDSGIGICVTA